MVVIIYVISLAFMHFIFSLNVLFAFSPDCKLFGHRSTIPTFFLINPSVQYLSIKFLILNMLKEY